MRDLMEFAAPFGVLGIVAERLALEADHKPAYWCLVTVGLSTRNGKIAVEGLKAYEKAFAVEFDLDLLAAKDPYKEIARTPEFTAWAKARRK